MPFDKLQSYINVYMLIVTFHSIIFNTNGRWQKKSFQSATSTLQESYNILCNTRLIVILGVQEKLCFFTIQCNPSLAYIAVRDLQSSQRNASVQSLLW